jgi:predicted esterase
MHTRRLGWACFLCSALGTYAGCGGDSESGGDGGSAGAGATAGASGSSGTDAGTTGGSAGAGAVAGNSGSGGSGGSGGSVVSASCSDAPPAGAPQAADPKAYSGGACPALVAGTNTISSGGADRAFVLALPSNIQPNESLPIVFLWHWLGGDANDFYERGEVQAAVDSQRFIGVLPEKKGDVLFTWPVEAFQGQARIDEELGFFDDMLACVSEQYGVNKNCVSSVGVSAGALWTAVLAGGRGDYLSSFISLSGGTGGVIKPWAKPAHKMPGIVLWGGPTDSCAGLLSFESLSGTLEDELTSGGHFFLECIHNCGHSEPPLVGAGSKYSGLWQFVLDHPFWLAPGESPYAGGAFPAGMPEWCGVGKGGSTPRTGECTNASEC